MHSNNANYFAEEPSFSNKNVSLLVNKRKPSTIVSSTKRSTHSRNVYDASQSTIKMETEPHRGGTASEAKRSFYIAGQKTENNNSKKTTNNSSLFTQVASQLNSAVGTRRQRIKKTKQPALDHI